MPYEMELQVTVPYEMDPSKVLGHTHTLESLLIQFFAVDYCSDCPVTFVIPKSDSLAGEDGFHLSILTGNIFF